MSIATSHQRFFIMPSGTTTKTYPFDTDPAIPASRLRTISTQIGSTQQTVRQQKFENIPYDEGMALYYQIKQRHDDLFRELADL